MGQNNTSPRLRAALKTVAGFEALKGVLALAALFGVLHLMHRDLHALALELIGHFHASPEQHFPRMLVEAADRINVTPVRTIAFFFCLYAAMRFTEAWGLWMDKPWGAWVGLVATGIYIPFELIHWWRDRHWTGLLVVAINVGLVVLLAVRARQRQQTTG